MHSRLGIISPFLLPFLFREGRVINIATEEDAAKVLEMVAEGQGRRTQRPVRVD
jgi:hypothetical protein